MDKKTMYIVTHKITDADSIKLEVNAFDSENIDLWVKKHEGYANNYVLVATLSAYDQYRLVEFIDSVKENI